MRFSSILAALPVVLSSLGSHADVQIGIGRGAVRIGVDIHDRDRDRRPPPRDDRDRRGPPDRRGPGRPHDPGPPHRRPPHYGNPYRPPGRPVPGPQRYQQIIIDRNVQNERIVLNNYLPQGVYVTGVDVYYQSNYRPTFQLLVNGYIAASDYYDDGVARLGMQYPVYNRFGGDLIQLDAMGFSFIRDIVVFYSY